MEQKLFKDMTAEEQLKWVTDFSTFTSEKLPLLEKMGDAWEQSSIKSMREGLILMSAFQYCREFVNKALHYGDYAARVSRLRIYIDKIKDELAKGLTVKGVNGETFAYVSPTVPIRRRGRPTKEEVAARQQGIIIPANDPELEKQQKIARLLGLDVVIGENTAREKNNAELAEERARKQAEYERQNPSLFAAPPAASVEHVAVPQQQTEQPPSPTPAQLAGNEPEYKLGIAQKKILLTPDLKTRAEQIRELRATAAAAAEKAKTMADLKASPEMIAPVAEEAQRTLEQVEAIYADIDEQLATIFYRLQNDSDDWRRQFLLKHGFAKTVATDKPVNVAEYVHEDLIHDLRMHYNKVKNQQPDFPDRMRRIIEQESPEHMAKVKAEEERKKEVADIIKYLRRQDKPNSLVRLTTMKERFARLSELMGEADAKPYYAFVQKAEEDYNEKFRAADEAEAKAKADAEAAKKAKAKAKAAKPAAKKAKPVEPKEKKAKPVEHVAVPQQQTERAAKKTTAPSRDKTTKKK